MATILHEVYKQVVDKIRRRKMHNALFLYSSSCITLPPSSKFPPDSLNTRKCKVQLPVCSAASKVASVGGPESAETLSARDRRRLRNERREEAKSSKPPWREEVEKKLSQRKKKPKSWMEEMNLDNLAVQGVQWWMLLVPRNSERLAADDLSKAFPSQFPDIEFQVYLPEIPSRRKLKNGSYSESKKRIFPGYLFIRGPLNKEIHDFIRNTPRVRGFFGRKVGSMVRQMIKPKPVPIAEMEETFRKVKEEQEAYEFEIKEELLKEERNKTDDDSIRQDLLENLQGTDVRMKKDAKSHRESTADKGGQQVGSVGTKSNSKKLPVVAADSTDYSYVPSAKGLKKQRNSGRKVTLSRKQDSILVAGSPVRVISGSFAGFTGHLKEIDVDTGKAKVLLMMFGHELPVDMDIDQVEREPSQDNNEP